MNINVLDIALHRNSQSHISILEIQDWTLFYIEWDYNKKIQMAAILGIWL